MQQLMFGIAQKMQAAERLQRIQRASNTKFRMIGAMQQLQILSRILDVDNASGTVFHVDLVPPDQFLLLSLPQMDGVLRIPCLAAVCKQVPMSLHTSA